MSEFDGRAFARSLGTGPGVYLMRDAAGKVLYVGKARNLRRRVASYFSRRDLGPRLNLLVRKVEQMEVSLTRTEAEALLLENEWIKAHRPRFNINLRDDKSYPWIRLETAHPYPRIGFYRGSRKPPHRYFGPFSSAGAVREALNQIYRLFGLRQCRDTVFENRTESLDASHNLIRRAEVILPLSGFAPSGRMMSGTVRSEEVRSVGLVAYGRDHVADVSLSAMGAL